MFVVGFAASLQFLGLGNSSELMWGTMLYNAQQAAALEAGNAWWALAPGAAVALLGAGFALLNYAFDEIGNPALRPVGGGGVAEPLLEVDDLTVDVPDRDGRRPRRRSTSASRVQAGEFLGIVGESGLREVDAAVRRRAAALTPRRDRRRDASIFRGQDMVRLSRQRAPPHALA